jgi:hypothetical protein
MIEIRRIWRHAGEQESIHFMLSSDATPTGERLDRHIKLKRAANPAMYDFISEHAVAIPADNSPDNYSEANSIDG